MNWLIIGIPLIVFYLGWLIYLLLKKQYNRNLLIVGLGHMPYLLLNVVAPFRGPVDPAYNGYHVGLIHVPPGIFVTLVAGGMAVGSFIILTKVLLNKMYRYWVFVVMFDLLLSVFIAIPLLVEIVLDLEGFRLELGEYLQIQGFFVALLFFLFLVGPTLYALYFAAKQVISKNDPK